MSLEFHMGFWLVSARVVKTSVHVQHDFLVESPHGKLKTKEILLSVHPEFSSVTLVKTDKPDWCKSWNE